jgi:hypothetical protein
MRMQSAARYGANVECGAVVPIGTTRIQLSLLPSYRSHRFLLHDVKQRSLLRSRGVLPSADSLLPLRSHLPPPTEGRRSAGDGSLAFPSRLRGATPYLPCDGRAPLGAPAWRFSAAGPALHLPAVPTGIRAATSPTARRSQAPGRSGPVPPKPRFAPKPGTPLPRSALRASPETPLVSEDGCTHTLSAR